MRTMSLQTGMGICLSQFRLFMRLGLRVMLMMFCDRLGYILYIIGVGDMKIKLCLLNGCCVFAILIGISLIALEVFFLEGLIRDQAEQGIVMTNQTYGLWGIIPGDTQTFTLRNFTVYNFTNPHDFIYKGSVTPSFVETGGFLYQQKCQFANHYFTEDDTKVNYDYWLYFDKLAESKNVDQKYTVINVAPLGFWMQLGTTAITSFTLQGFGGLFVQMENTIKTQALGQGVSSTFLKTYDVFSLLCNDLAIDPKFCWYLWNDRYYGLDSQVNMQFWVKAAYYKDQQTKQCLYQHFYPMPAMQFEALLYQIKQLAQGVNQILQNWYCRENQVCDGYKFTLKQISGAGITNNPPPGSDASESICSTNSTCVGSPQITTFLHHEFRKKYPDQKYQVLVFSQATFQTLFTPYEGLLNIGTLNKIYEIGLSYDKSQKAAELEKLRLIFNADTPDHAFVIWEWIKYMTEEFVLKLGRGGSRKIAGLGGVFSQAWYQVSFSFADWFLKDAYSFLAYQQMGKNCSQAMNFLQPTIASQICQQNIPDPKNYTYYYSLIEPCLNFTKFYQFSERYKILPTKMQDYCDVDEDPSNIGLITLKILQTVSTHYNCNQSLPSKKCTERDIIVKQLFHSRITLNPLEIPEYRFYNKPTIIANKWNSEIPTFQYKHFLQLSNITDVQQHLQSEVRDLFTFDKLLNGPEVQELFITDNDVEFYHKYHWVNPPYLRNYMRYIVLEVGFGGFTQQRSPKQVFFGYTDPFLQNLKQTDTMAGGDPSIQSLIAFNELNMTQEQAKINKQVMFTGAGDTKRTRQFVSLFQKNFIAVNSTHYDGKNVKWQMVSPWAQNVKLEGSDGFSVPPNGQQNETPPVYISSIARFANVAYKKSIKKFDMQLWDMRISKNALQSMAENPENAKYYQGIHCFLNSSYQGFPLFVSKNHFLDAQPKWQQLVKITDERGNIMTANDWDDTRLYIEPYTGTAFSATVYLQSNYYYQADDILFPSSELFRANKNKQKQQSQNQNNLESGKQYRMLPIVNTFRSGNISANAVGKYFGDLRDIINNKRKVALTGWFIISLCAVVWLSLRVHSLLVAGKTIREVGGKKSLLETEILDE